MSYGGQQDLLAQQLSFALISSFVNNCMEDCKMDFSSSEYSQSERTCLTNCALRNAEGQKLLQQVQQEMQSRMQGGFQ